MARYIELDALLAEIKRRKELVSDPILSGDDLMIGERNAYFNLLPFINTLEVKEVDLDALGVLAEHLIACDAHGITPKYRDRELDILEGLVNNKAQKGEKV